MRLAMTDMTVHAKSPLEFSPLFVPTIAATVLVWFVLVGLLGAAGVFQAPPDTPPVAILIAVVLPPLLLLTLMRTAPSFRRQVLAIDPIWLASVQGLRILGLSFLFLYAFGVVPGLFAHPAGWGDMAVGLIAPFMAVRIAREPSFLTSPWYWRFHALGMLDFISALGSAMLAQRLADSANTLPLVDWPLVFVPAFGVPLFICLHLTAFAQIRAARQAAAA
jgi:hypothetical protein